MGGVEGRVCKPSPVHYTLFLTKQQSAWCTDWMQPVSWVQILSTQWDLSQMPNFLLPQISPLYC